MVETRAATVETKPVVVEAEAATGAIPTELSDLAESSVVSGLLLMAILPCHESSFDFLDLL